MLTSGIEEWSDKEIKQQERYLCHHNKIIELYSFRNS